MPAVETKVQAASLAAAVSGAVLWALQVYAFKGGAVPAGLVSLIDLAVPAVLAAAAGYLAPHTPRPGLVPVATRPVWESVTMTSPPPPPPGPPSSASAP
jgi:hypothetical protein